MTYFHPLNVKALLTQELELPICPAPMVRLMALLNEPSDSQRSVSDLVRILSSDQALTLEILSLANSPRMQIGVRVRSLNEAVIALGYKEIWSLAAIFILKGVYRVGGWDAFNENLWIHTLKCSCLARRIARVTSPFETEMLFTAALLHDIGKLLMIRADVTYGLVCADGWVHGDELIQKERQRFATDHAEMGADLMKHWMIPDEITELVRLHHAAESQLLTHPRVQQVRTIQLANLLSYGWRTDAGSAIFDFSPTLPTAFKDMFANDHDLEQCLAGCAGELSLLRDGV